MDSAEQLLSLACQVCCRPCGEAFPCPGCNALYYCSSKHQKLRARLGHDLEQCIRMKQQIERSQDVYQQQLQWPAQTPQEVCCWLQQLHCHTQGPLQNCCPVHTAAAEQHQQQMPEHSSLSTCPHYSSGWEPDGSGSSGKCHLVRNSTSVHNECDCSSKARSSCSKGALPCSKQQWEAAWAPLAVDQIPCWICPVDCVVDSTGQSSTSRQHWPGTGGQGTREQSDAIVNTRKADAEPQNCDQAQQQQQQNFQQLPGNWREYYALRQIPDSSPAALALHFPLTLWYCLTVLLPQHGWQLPPPGERLPIVYLGPQSEVLLLPLFAELSLLLPHHHMDIHMVGPDVPEELHAKCCIAAAPAGQGSLSISCWSGCFHDLTADWQHCEAAQVTNETATATNTATDIQLQPVQCHQTLDESENVWQPAVPPSKQLHLIFAANAGLPAFPAWLPTLQQLLLMCGHGKTLCTSDATTTKGLETTAISHATIPCLSVGREAGVTSCGGGISHSRTSVLHKATPVLFSDYCEEVVVNSQQMAEGLLGQGFDVQCLLNPFRQPARQCGHGTKLPACSNGFLFGWL